MTHKIYPENRPTYNDMNNTKSFVSIAYKMRRRTSFDFFQLTVLCVLYSATFVNGYIDCFLNTTEIGKFSPLFLVENKGLDIPKSAVITLKSNEEILLACPGARNQINLFSAKSVRATCAEDNQLQVLDEKYNLEEVNCKQIIRGDIKKTNQVCGDENGQVVFIGYQIDDDYIPLIKVCYDEVVGRTLYTEHRINGNDLKNSARLSGRPGFSVDGLGSNIAAASAYEKIKQKATFTQIFGSAKTAEKYIFSKSFLSRGHLSPVADFPLITSKISTFFYINAVPQWQGINSANWVSLESLIRKTALYYNDLEVITGTHDTLTLPDDLGDEKEIFLQSKSKIPVPKYIWKMVYDKQSQSGIVFVILNNPFEESILESDVLCQNDICRENGWYSSAWGVPKSGYLQCCSVQEFIKLVRTAPRIKVRDILQGINPVPKSSKRIRVVGF